MKRLFLLCLALALPSMAPAVDPAAFMQKYCVDCHGPDKQKGDRRFDRLALPAARADDVTDLQDIIDQLNLGEMPPKKSPQPEAGEQKALVALLTDAVAEARAKFRSTGGQSVLRRLNRREYLQTVGDLFALDMRLFDPTTKFPRDQMAEHMDNLGDVLQTSGYLLAQYLEAADLVVEKAMGMREKPQERQWVFKDKFVPQQEHVFPHRAVYDNRYLCLYEVPDTENHEGGYGYLSGFREGVPSDGVYEIRVHARAMNREHPYDPDIFGRVTEETFRLGLVPGDAAAGPLHHPQPIEPNLAEVTLKDGEAEWHTFKVPLLAGQTPRFIFPNGMANSRRAFGTLARRYKDQWPEHERKDLGIFQARRVVLEHGFMPHIRVDEVQVRGPLVAEWPPASQKAVLGGRVFAPARIREILASFASRAYRRPVTEAELDRLMAVATARQAAGVSPYGSLKDALKAALCTPAFLYLEEPADDRGCLTAHALAARLSYFLTSSLPDADLRRCADDGSLLRSEVLRAQAERLLDGPRSEAFVASFLDSWLNLRSLGDMPPDREAFAVYYARGLQAAMKKETQMFMRHLLATDGSLVRFLDADYTFVNQPLASLYGLGQIAAPDEAHEFRQVKLALPQRGGLLGQGSVLTVSANGIETSPVTRGVWLLENILGTPPSPPPDNVPPIDPDIRGAKSMRDILTKHRDNPGCYECHQKIDPLGFALENFDPIGTWRTHYPQGKKTGPRIDAAGELPGGQAFDDIAGLKRILVGRQDQFARMLTEKLLSYACGRRMEAMDRPVVEGILEKCATQDMGLKSLVLEIVGSETFRSK